MESKCNRTENEELNFCEHMEAEATYDKCQKAKKILEERQETINAELLTAVLEKDFDQMTHSLSQSRDITQANLKLDVIANVASEQRVRERVGRQKKEILDMVCPEI